MKKLIPDREFEIPGDLGRELSKLIGFPWEYESEALRKTVTDTQFCGCELIYVNFVMTRGGGSSIEDLTWKKWNSFR